MITLLCHEARTVEHHSVESNNLRNDNRDYRLNRNFNRSKFDAITSQLKNVNEKFRFNLHENNKPENPQPFLTEKSSNFIEKLSQKFLPFTILFNIFIIMYLICKIIGYLLEKMLLKLTKIIENRKIYKEN